MSESSVDQPETGPRSEEELRRILRTKTDPLAALQQGIQLMRHGAGLGLGALVVYSAISAAGAGMAKEFSIELIGSEPDVYSAWAFLLLLVSALLALYTLIQFVKRDRVTRASWIPSLFLVASLAMYGAMSLGPSMGGTNNTQLAPLVPTLVMIAWDLVWESFGGAALVFIWLSCAHAGMNGRELVPSDLFADLRRRWLDVAAVHGAKFHAVQIGMQVVIPGIFYALSLAFADMIVVLDPERPALKRSAQLTFGMRGRLFRLLVIYVAVTLVLQAGVYVAVDGTGDAGVAGRIAEMFINPLAPSVYSILAMRFIPGAAAWAVALAMLVLYQEREAQVVAKRELRALKEMSGESASA